MDSSCSSPSRSVDDTPTGVAIWRSGFSGWLGFLAVQQLQNLLLPVAPWNWIGPTPPPDMLAATELPPVGPPKPSK